MSMIHPVTFHDTEHPTILSQNSSCSSCKQLHLSWASTAPQTLLCSACTPWRQNKVLTPHVLLTALKPCSLFPASTFLPRDASCLQRAHNVDFRLATTTSRLGGKSKPPVSPAPSVPASYLTSDAQVPPMQKLVASWLWLNIVSVNFSAQCTRY